MGEEGPAGSGDLKGFVSVHVLFAKGQFGLVRRGLIQTARRRLAEVLSARHKERLERERRRPGLAVEVLTALAERDERSASPSGTQPMSSAR
jgi:hypothetical protein